MSRLPEAVWSGEIYGIKVHVLDDGRRIVDADDLHRLFDGTESAEDMTNFARVFRSFMDGTYPHEIRPASEAPSVTPKDPR